MYRVTGTTLGAAAIGLVAVFLVVGMVGGGLLGAPHSVSGQTAKGSPAGVAGKNTATVATVAGVNPGAVTVSAAFTSTFSPYMVLPIGANYTITVTGATINATTTTMFVNVSDISTGKVLQVNPIVPASGQTSYFFNVTYKSVGCYTAACNGLPQDEFKVQVATSVGGVTAVISKQFFLVTVPLQASLVSPAPGAAVSTGNVTVSVAYLGSYVAGAVLNIYSSTGSLVFQQSVIELTPGVPQAQTWFIAQTGTYSYSIVMTTVYLPTTHYFNGTLTVVTKGGTVFQNVTKWSNQSILSGLSGAAAGTMLLVVGLIVGMIVAFLLARAVMGSRPTSAPPQAWEGKPGAAGAAPNTCSVCGKSFSTPEELAAHAKSEHGMQ